MSNRKKPPLDANGVNLALDLLIELHQEFERIGPDLTKPGPRGGRAAHVKVCDRYLRRAHRAGVDVERAFCELLRRLAACRARRERP